MATISPSSIAAWADSWVRPPTTNVQTDLMDMAVQAFAGAAEWRWLLSRLAGTAIVPAQQDYVFATPASFLRISGVLMQLGDELRMLLPTAATPNASDQGVPSMFSFAESGGNITVSVWPRPATGMAGTLTPLARLAHTPITAGNFSSTSAMLHPDAYNDIVRLYYLHYLKRYTDDDSAGSVRVSIGADGRRTVEYSGLLAEAEARVAEIAPREGLLFDATLGGRL